MGLAMKLLARGLLAVGLLHAAFVGTQPVGAQAPPEDSAGDGKGSLRRECFDLSLQLIRAEALAEELRAEEVLLRPDEAVGIDSTSKPLSARAELWEQAFDRSSVAGVATGSLLADFLQTARKDEEAAVRAWHEATERSLAFYDKEVPAAEEQVGRSWTSPRKTGEGRTIWGLLTFLSVGAVTAGLLLTLHEARDRIRWRLRALGSRPSLIVLALASAVLACGSAHDSSSQAVTLNPDLLGRLGQGLAGLTGRRDELRRELAATEQANSAASERLRHVMESLRYSRVTYGLQADNPKQKQTIDRVLAAAEHMQEQFRAIRVSARSSARIAAAVEQLNEGLASDRDRLALFIAENRETGRRESLAKLTCSGVSIVAIVVPLTVVRRIRRRRLNEESRMCPRCLKKDTLQIEDAASAEPVDHRQPKARLAVCESCEYDIRENYIREHRLCFPTVGIRYSGKTHWLLILYDKIKKANVMVESKIKKIPSREDARFDQMVEEVLYNRGRTSATVYGLPYPLTFHVNDNDPLGKSRTMVNMFDFAGDLTQFRIDGETQQNEFRRRALLCEGFTLFLDPTQVSREARTSIEAQIRALAEFVEEMHAMRGIPMEKPIDLPIAVCVSKIDLLVNQNPMGTQAVPFVAKLRETMGLTPNLRLVHERSQLTAMALPQMFPGWNIERELSENFGGRYMFFPSSSVGLEEHELGVDNFSDRSLAPFGSLEPLLWLLHMHGYCVMR